MEHLKSDQILIDLLEKGCPIQETGPVYHKMVKDGYNPAHDCYFLLSHVLSMGPYPIERLELIREIVSSPAFVCKPEEYPDSFIQNLASSTYWLDMKLYTPDAYKKKIDDKRMPYDLMLLLDIGSMLIDKGFNFTTKYFVQDNGNAKLAWCANYYLKECLKRNAFLKKKSAHKKRLPDGSKKYE